MGKMEAREGGGREERDSGPDGRMEGGGKPGWRQRGEGGRGGGHEGGGRALPGVWLGEGAERLQNAAGSSSCSGRGGGGTPPGRREVGHMASPSVHLSLCLSVN